jgi:hypothetical protein
MITRREWLALTAALACGRRLAGAQKTTTVTLVVDGMT